MPVWPNLFIAGAPRCGTSSLHAYLQAIPGIYMSRIKEPNFFSCHSIGDDHPMIRPIRDEKQYLKLFAAAGDARIVGEASPTYLTDPEAPSLIDRRVPQARVIVSLRDPVERLYSHYLMMLNNRPAMGSFREEIERGLAGPRDRDVALLLAPVGLYHDSIERYRQVFGDRFKILIFEEWRADVARALGEILAFLGIDYDLRDFAEPPQRRYSEARGPLVRYLFGNRAVSRASEALIPYRLRKLIRNAFLVKDASKPPMDPRAREFLVHYYREDVERLEKLLGRRLPWRNFGFVSSSRSVG